MTFPEPTTLWLPSTEQIRVAPERAILAALDANLELVIRSLKAEHLALDSPRLATDPDYEPHTFNLLPIAKDLVLGAKRLRQLAIEYRIATDALLRDAEDGIGESPDPIDDADDDRFPF